MATRALPGNTSLSALVSAGLANGDVLQLAGFELAVDCDARDKSVSIQGPGKIELRNGGGIYVSGSVPNTVDWYVDPDHPLPSRNVEAGLTANASAEIVVAPAVNNSVIWGGFDCPTETGLGEAVGIATAWSPDNKTLHLDRNLDVVPGDVMFPSSRTNNSETTAFTVSSVEHAAKSCAVTFTVAVSNSNMRLVGNWWGVMSGGVLLHGSRAGSSGGSYCIWTYKPIRCGILNILFDYGYHGISCPGRVNRFVSRLNSGYYACSPSGTFVCDLLVSSSLNSAVGDSVFGRAYCAVPLQGPNGESGGSVRILSGACMMPYDGYQNTPGRGNGIPTLLNASCSQSGVFNNSAPLKVRVRLENCTIAGNETGVSEFSPECTCRLVSRSSFPADTDLPDAWYYAPAFSNSEAWKAAGTYRVRKGGTLRLSVRAFLGGDDSVLRVGLSVFKGAYTLPLNPRNSGLPPFTYWNEAVEYGMLHSDTEWSLENGDVSLKWIGKTVCWTNDTGEDADVAAFVVCSGLSGAYAQVWEATGGAL